jgi:UDPglucose 6-dehydrogenase
MTTVGWLGLGKLGLPCAAAMACRGVTVAAYDIDHARRDMFAGKVALPDEEPGLPEALAEAARRGTLLVAASIGDLVAAEPDLIFVCVQTPHAPGYDGSTPAPEVRRSFDYTALRSAVAAVAETDYDGLLAVMSTVTPGTMDRCVRPLLSPGMRLVYNPAFPAMGSVIDDYLNPALVLIGIDEGPACWECAEGLIDLYRQVCHNEPAYQVTSVPSAELAKVAYNAFVSTKITFANALMELCHHTGADVDEVTGTLALATDRVISSRYLRGGMGDGGACHPRDLIAMSAEAEHYGLSYDPFGELVRAREAQTGWLADLALYHAELAGLDTVVVLGKSYKAGSAITAGSPGLLLAGMLDGHGVKVLNYDPLVDGHDWPEAAIWPNGDELAHRAVFVLATPHGEFKAWELPAGSVLIDPWRSSWEPGPGVTRIAVGAR